VPADFAKKPDFKPGSTVLVVGQVVAALAADEGIDPGLSVRLAIRQTCGGFNQVHVPLSSCRTAPTEEAA
jgi:hypothetical protein